MYPIFEASVYILMADHLIPFFSIIFLPIKINYTTQTKKTSYIKSISYTHYKVHHLKYYKLTTHNKNV